MSYKLIHGHGNYGPNGKKSYIVLGTYKSKKTALAAKKRMGGDRVVASSKLKSLGKGLYYLR